MAGGSLTLFWLDDELERLWNAPVDTPAYRRGSVVAAARRGHRRVAADVASRAIPRRQRRVAAGRTAWRARRPRGARSPTIDAHVDELGRMDAIAGDGDHGIGMQRGAHAALDAARAAAQPGAGAGTLLAHAGDAWSDRAGGTSGALWGVALRGRRRARRRRGAERGTPSRPASPRARDGIQSYGKAEVGDKTMVDALVPFAETLGREVDGGATSPTPGRTPPSRHPRPPRPRPTCCPAWAAPAPTPRRASARPTRAPTRSRSSSARSPTSLAGAPAPARKRKHA